MTICATCPEDCKLYCCTHSTYICGNPICFYADHDKCIIAENEKKVDYKYPPCCVFCNNEMHLEETNNFVRLACCFNVGHTTCYNNMSYIRGDGKCPDCEKPIRKVDRDFLMGEIEEITKEGIKDKSEDFINLPKIEFKSILSLVEENTNTFSDAAILDELVELAKKYQLDEYKPLITLWIDHVKQREQKIRKLNDEKSTLQTLHEKNLKLIDDEENTEMQKLNADMIEKEEKIITLEERINALTKNHEITLKEITDKKNKSTQKNAFLKKSLTKLTQNKEIAEKQISVLKKELSDLTQTDAENYQKLKKKNDHLLGKIDQLTAQNSSLEKQIDQCKKQTSQLMPKIQELQVENQNQKDDFDQLKLASTGLAQKFQAKATFYEQEKVEWSQKINSFNQREHELIEKNKKLEEDKKSQMHSLTLAHRKEIENLSQIAQNCRKEMREKSDELQTKEKHIKKLSEEVEEKTNKALDLSTANMEYAEQIYEKDNEFDEVNTELKESKSKVKKLQKENASLEEAVAKRETALRNEENRRTLTETNSTKKIAEILKAVDKEKRLKIGAERALEKEKGESALHQKEKSDLLAKLSELEEEKSVYKKEAESAKEIEEKVKCLAGGIQKLIGGDRVRLGLPLIEQNGSGGEKRILEHFKATLKVIEESKSQIEQLKSEGLSQKTKIKAFQSEKETFAAMAKENDSLKQYAELEKSQRIKLEALLSQKTATLEKAKDESEQISVQIEKLRRENEKLRQNSGEKKANSAVLEKENAQISSEAKHKSESLEKAEKKVKALQKALELYELKKPNRSEIAGFGEMDSTEFDSVLAKTENIESLVKKLPAYKPLGRGELEKVKTAAKAVAERSKSLDASVMKNAKKSSTSKSWLRSFFRSNEKKVYVVDLKEHADGKFKFDEKTKTWIDMNSATAGKKKKKTLPPAKKGQNLRNEKGSVSDSNALNRYASAGFSLGFGEAERPPKSPGSYSAEKANLTLRLLKSKTGELSTSLKLCRETVIGHMAAKNNADSGILVKQDIVPIKSKISEPPINKTADQNKAKDPNLRCLLEGMRDLIENQAESLDLARETHGNLRDVKQIATRYKEPRNEAIRPSRKRGPPISHSAAVFGLIGALIILCLLVIFEETIGGVFQGENPGAFGQFYSRLMRVLYEKFGKVPS